LTVDLVLQGGTLVTEQGSLPGGLAIDGGKVVALGASANRLRGERVLDAYGLYILPGVIDGHVHFREPGLEHKEDFHSGSMAAAAGGVTTVLDMPNVNPPTADPESFGIKLERAREKSIVDFGIFAVVLPSNLGRIRELAGLGIVGYKIFMGETVGNLPSLDDQEMSRAFEEVAKSGLRVGVHAEDRAMTRRLAEELKRGGRSDPLVHLESRPSASEAEAVRRAIALAKPHSAKLHVFHLSSKEGVGLVAQARGEGLPLTSETCPHYLLFDGTAIKDLGPLLKINPPVRGPEHSRALWEGLRNGTIDMIASDHSPHTPEEKFKSNFWEAVSGFPGVETMVPLMLNEVSRGRLALSDIARYISVNPAKVWGLHPRKGSLGQGADGDVTVVDLRAEATIRAENLHSKSKITPFGGWAVRGLPVYTVVGGRVVMERGQVLEDAGRGSLVSPGSAGISSQRAR
jgi:dihydroorotase